MKRALVTGAAGFIGSHLAEALQASSVEVVAVDRLAEYYDLGQKRSNLEAVESHGGVQLVFDDLAVANLDPLLEGVDTVFHLAGQPGVRSSWSDGFGEYVSDNVLATQRLLEAVLRSDVGRFVYSSSSSVYGDRQSFPVNEAALPHPHSPYGATKLAGEHLVNLYADNYGLSTVSLRYFTVYGPRQRPDMAFHRLLEAALHEQAFALNGDGSQVRDFTFVSDVVSANLAAAGADVEPGTVLNIAGGAVASMNEVIEEVGSAVGVPLKLAHRPTQKGDVARTEADTALARDLLGWQAAVSLKEGIEKQLAWHERRARPSAAEVDGAFA